MSRGSKARPQSIRSSLLNSQENEQLEELLGRRCAVSSDPTGGRDYPPWGTITGCICSDFPIEEFVVKELFVVVDEASNIIQVILV